MAALFAHVGQPVQLKDAAEMSVVTPVTALMAPYYQLLDSVTKWMTAGGVRQQAASVFVGSLFHALSVDALKVQGAPRLTLLRVAQRTRRRRGGALAQRHVSTLGSGSTSSTYASIRLPPHTHTHTPLPAPALASRIVDPSFMTSAPFRFCCV